MKKIVILLAMLFLVGTAMLTAQETGNNTTKKEKKHKKQKKHKKEKKEGAVSVVWLPVLAANPTYGVMYGVAPALNWRAGSAETTSLSTALSSIVLTTKKQFLFTFKSTAFLKDDAWLLTGDWRYFITSQPTYGLGTGPQSVKLAGSTGFEYEDGLFSDTIDTAQMMEFDFLRFYETVFKRINDTRFFAGLGYHLDIHSKIKDNLLNLTDTPETITSAYAYDQQYGFKSDKYVTSGVSLNGMYDNRDNTVNPYKGMYALATFKMYPEWLGSTKPSSTLWLEYRGYFNLKKERPRNLLALWIYGNFQTSGELPYLDLAAVGWDQFGRSGRAYTQGRFRGQSLAYTELEWRFPLQKTKDKIGGVLFANFTTASNKDANIKLYDQVNKGIGAGLRYMLNNNRTNLCLDFAVGDYGAKGFYLSVNEVF